jgi:YidC/Oxa1 family membrane protein insertase
MVSIFDVPVDAAYHLVAGFTGILTPVLGGLAAVAAIVAVTIAVRLLLMPLSLRALRGQAIQARLAPELAALRQRYKSQPERLQREMTALYRREGTSMFAGFVPILLQWPVLSVVYLLFRSSQVAGKPNTLLGHALLGVPLGAHWLSGAGPLSGPGLVFTGVFALLAVLCWLAARLARRMAPPVPAGPVPAGRGAAGSGSAGASASAPGGALVRVLPYLTVVIAAFVPLAAGIYLVTSTAWSLAERAFFWRSGQASSLSRPEASAAAGPAASRAPASGRGSPARAGQGRRR